MLLSTLLHHFSALFFLMYLHKWLGFFDIWVSGDLFLTDFPNSLNLNDSLINMFNFFWTSITYLPIFFSTLCFVTYLILYLNTNPLVLILGVFFFLQYSIELSDFIALNTTPTLLDFNSLGLNTLLINSLNKYHPLLFYGSVALYLVTSVNNIPLYENDCSFDPLFSLSLSSSYSWLLLNCITTTLIWGSWWAFQEGTWGGWWNWDPSEVFGLALFILAVFTVHSPRTISSLSLNRESNLLFLTSFLILYFFLQLNFDLTSHSFGARFTSYFNNTFFFFENLTLFSSLIVYIICNTSLYWSNILSFNVGISNLTQSNLGTYIYWFWFSHKIVWLVIITSFMPLVNYFLWSYFCLMSFNSFIIFETIITMLYVGLFVFFLNRSYSYLCIGLLLNIYTFTSLLTSSLLLTLFNFTYFSSIHFFLTTLIYVNLVTNEQSYLVWSTYGTFCDTQCGSLFVNIAKGWYSCDSPFIEFWNLNSLNFIFNTVSSNTYYNSNTPSSLDLDLFTSGDNFSTLFILSREEFSPILSVEIPTFNFFSDILLFLIFYLITNVPHSLPRRISSFS